MKIILGKTAVLMALLAGFLGAGHGFAQEPDANRITEHDKQVFKNIKEAIVKEREQAKKKEVLVMAISNLRQVGLALLEFESDYGEFPSGETVAAVKENTVSKAELKSATANDCFFQLMVAEIVTTDRIFTYEKPADAWNGKGEMPAKLRKCGYAYFYGMNAAGHPGRPLVVAPLVKDKQVFDPAVFGGKAVVLRLDNSVVALPIDKDGRVMIDGKDIFDPEQPFWGGKVAPVRWPEN